MAQVSGLTARSRFRRALGVVAALLLVGCSGGDQAPAVPSPAVASTTTASSTTQVASSASPKDAACAEFLRITADLSLDDAELAAAYFDLATRSGDPGGLGIAILKVAEGFERGDTEVSSAEVNGFCGFGH